MTNFEYGQVIVPATARTVTLLARKQDNPLPIIGRLVYFDTQIGDTLYRAIGTVSSMNTSNSQFNASYESHIAIYSHDNGFGSDLRKSEVAIQAVFQKDGVSWKQAGSALPTSPSTGAKVFLMDEESVKEMIAAGDYPSVGFFRGLNTAPLPLNIPNFDSSRGSYHSGVLGRSGSGKTQLYGLVLGGYMRHENHAIMVIDPQGQWANENGMIFSPQQLAKGLGREVTVLRVAEDIKLPMEVDILSRMIDKINLWNNFRRMGNDQKESLSREVAELLSYQNGPKLDRDSRVVLGEVFGSIAQSSSALSRIYVPGERQDRLRDELLDLAGLQRPQTEDGEIPIISEEDQKQVEANWKKILFAFSPLHSLFQSKNIAGTKRRPLSDEWNEAGFLTDVFQIRSDNPSKPAPYVVLDMSPNVSLHAKAGLDRSNPIYGMQKLLDDQDIKALILIMLLDEMKKASEVSFSSGSGNLNTQIVFDEAWRYAPERGDTPEIEELAKKLEGFALDTRKFGIGWTYILQSPSDLRQGIWRQLSFVYSGYGLVGDDVKRLEGLTDDPKQIDLYRQFISPTATNVYPFMVMGPISPLIFTSSPTFLNAFSGSEEFLYHNQNWINEITTRRSLPNITSQYLSQTPERKSLKATGEQKEYQLGKNYKVSEPQFTPPVQAKKVVSLSDLNLGDPGDTPF